MAFSTEEDLRVFLSGRARYPILTEMPDRSPPSGLMLVVSGPAGSGKTTLCDRMLNSYDGLSRVITSTSRAPRAGEIDGTDYYFFPPEEFERMIAEGEFYEHAQVHGRFYGSLKREIDEKLAAGVDLLLNVDVQGAATYRQASLDSEALNGRVISVFLEITADQIRERLDTRGSDDEAEIQRRIETAQSELLASKHFDYVIVSGTKDEDFARLSEIYLNEKAARQAKVVD
ncbi:MAG: guanylate kinase [Verrucomicrobiota bacterium]